MRRVITYFGVPSVSTDTSQVKYVITVPGTKRDGHKVIGGYAGGGYGGCGIKGGLVRTAVP